MPHPDSPDRVRNCSTDVAGQLREISVRLELDAWLVFPWLIPEHRQLADDSAMTRPVRQSGSIAAFRPSSVFSTSSARRMTPASMQRAATFANNLESHHERIFSKNQIGAARTPDALFRLYLSIHNDPPRLAHRFKRRHCVTTASGKRGWHSAGALRVTSPTEPTAPRTHLTRALAPRTVLPPARTS